jgi:hypothetical protein
VAVGEKENFLWLWTKKKTSCGCGRKRKLLVAVDEKENFLWLWTANSDTHVNMELHYKNITNYLSMV